VIPAEGGRPEEPVLRERHAVDPNWSPDGKSLSFGRLLASEAPGAGTLDVEIVDLQTHAVSKVPGSEELWDPRWSPDGRHIFAKSRAGDRLMLFDVRTRKWTELAKILVDWPEWSRQGDYVYFVGATREGPANGIFRLRISDHKLEQVASLPDFRKPPPPGNWVGLAPDDSPLLLRDAGTQEIYALDWEAP
jgi:Tol biopolymer transport system component